MFGQKQTELVLVRCACCKKWYVVRVDPEDLHVHKRGMFVQDAFINRDGTPYLSPGERELMISRLCPRCWDALCPSDKLAYS